MAEFKKYPKVGAYILLGLFATLFITVGFYAYGGYRSAGLDGLVTPGLVAILTAFLFILFFKKFISATLHGFPLKDERTKQIETRAAALAYFVSIYVWLGIMFIEDSLTTGRAAEIAIVVSAAVFGGAYMHYDRLSQTGK